MSPRITSLRQRNVLASLPYSPPQVGGLGYLPEADHSVQFSHSVLSDSLPLHGLQHVRLPVYHQLPELAQTQACQIADAIQPSHPLLPPSPTTFFLLRR